MNLTYKFREKAEHNDERSKTMTLKDELNVIDETIVALECRRTELINQMDARRRPRPATPKVGADVITFPARATIVETRYRSGRHVW
jgi:hypothetical protein